MKRKTPIKAIRAKCIDCCCGDLKEVRECTIEECPLWPYRMGRRPKDDEHVDNASQLGKLSWLALFLKTDNLEWLFDMWICVQNE